MESYRENVLNKIKEKEKKRNKTVAVKEWLEAGNSITSIEAFGMFGATRLSAIIWKLRKKGMRIKSEDIVFVDKYGTTCVCCAYSLERDSNDDGDNDSDT